MPTATVNATRFRIHRFLRARIRPKAPPRSPPPPVAPTPRRRYPTDDAAP